MLLKKLILFSLILIATEQLAYNLAIKKLISPFWGNDEINAKMKYISLHKEINTAFVGSSKVRTQIVPAVFDSVTGGTTKSFNVGCNGLFIPESFMILDYLLDSTAIKTILFEIRPPYHIDSKNLHITRTTYYHTAASYFQLLNITCHSNLPFIRKLSVYSTYTIAEVENLLNFNLAEGMINYRNSNYKEMAEYYAMEGGSLLLSKARWEPVKTIESGLKARAGVSIDYMRRYSSDSLKAMPGNEPYLNELKRIISKAVSKQKKIIFIFPPALREFEYNEILPLLRELPDVPQLIFADASVFPQLYNVENNYETDHLNVRGSKIYSAELGKAFTKIFINPR